MYCALWFTSKEQNFIKLPLFELILSRLNIFTKNSDYSYSGLKGYFMLWVKWNNFSTSKKPFLQTAFCLRSSLTRFSFCYSKLLFLCELLSLGSCIFYPYQCFYSENIFAIQFYLDIFFEDVCLITLMLWRLIQNLPRIVITMGTHTWTKIYWHLVGPLYSSDFLGKEAWLLLLLF